MEVMPFIWFAILFYIYFIPTIWANQRRHKSKAAIAMLNLFLGWTGLGWIVAVIWAGTGYTQEAR